MSSVVGGGGGSGAEFHNGFMDPPKKIPRKGRSLKNLNPRKALRVFIANSQNKENGAAVVVGATVAAAAVVTGAPARFGRINTGMEKEEEREHHLQLAIQTQKASLVGSAASTSTSSIPIPRVESIDIRDYRVRSERPSRAHRDFNEEVQWIQAVSHDDYSMRSDTYELDEDDALWLERMASKNINLSPDDFEKIVEGLENCSRKQVISVAAAFVKFPKECRQTIIMVYDYWLDKRLNLCKSTFPSASLIPIVPNEPDYEDKNPFVAFRKREKDFRRRSLRLAYHNALASSVQAEQHVKTPEELAIENEQRLNDMLYRPNINSDLDGPFAFKRDRRCTYRNYRPREDLKMVVPEKRSSAPSGSGSSAPSGSAGPPLSNVSSFPSSSSSSSLVYSDQPCCSNSIPPIKTDYKMEKMSPSCSTITTAPPPPAPPR